MLTTLFTAWAFAITPTTTSHGDIILPENVRILGGLGAPMGIVMCGLGTGMCFARFARIMGCRAISVSPEKT